jgi:hypothetical protein
LGHVLDPSLFFSFSSTQTGIGEVFNSPLGELRLEISADDCLVGLHFYTYQEQNPDECWKKIGPALMGQSLYSLLEEDQLIILMKQEGLLKAFLNPWVVFVLHSLWQCYRPRLAFQMLTREKEEDIFCACFGTSVQHLSTYYAQHPQATIQDCMQSLPVGVGCAQCLGDLEQNVKLCQKKVGPPAESDYPSLYRVSAETKQSTRPQIKHFLLNWRGKSYSPKDLLFLLEQCKELEWLPHLQQLYPSLERIEFYQFLGVSYQLTLHCYFIQNQSHVDFDERSFREELRMLQGRYDLTFFFFQETLFIDGIELSQSQENRV